MASPNINLRDPVLYRILHAAHPRTGDAWCIYPTYDFAHGQSDAIEGITHSLCTLEFEDHRPLYDWFLENLPVPSRPRQYEFARLKLTYTVLSQALPAAAGRRGPRARLGRPAHADHLGHAPARLPGGGHPRLRDDDRRRQGRQRRSRSALLEYAVRDVLNRDAPRRFGGARPAQGRHRQLPGRARSRRSRRPTTPRIPQPARARCRSRASCGSSATTSWRTRRPSSSAWHRAARCACATRTSSPATRSSRTPPARSSSCAARYDPATRGGDAPDGRRPKATLHWVSAAHAVAAEVRLYDHLFTTPTPAPDGDLLADLNPDSEKVVADALVEPSLADARPARRSSSSAWATSASTPTRDRARWSSTAR